MKRANKLAQETCERACARNVRTSLRMKRANELAHKGIKTIKVGDKPLVKGACLLPFFIFTFFIFTFFTFRKIQKDLKKKCFRCKIIQLSTRDQ